MKHGRARWFLKELGNGFGDGPVNCVDRIVDRLFAQIPCKPLENMVGATGFEPVTSAV